MYTIREAAARSGVAEARLRAWERRYGVVSPARTPGGYRLYDDAAIARIRAMRALVDGGWGAAQAAEAVLSSSTESGVAEPRTIAASLAGASLVEAAASYDLVAIESAIDELVGRGSFEAVVDDLLLPAVADLGTAWADGRIDVAGEHLASEAVQRRLAALFDLAGRPASNHTVAVGLPPGCRHEIGTLAFAVALRRRGFDVLYLGPDTPTASWVHVVVSTRMEGVVIGVPRAADVGAARDVGSALRAAAPALVVAFGGPAAAAAAEGLGHILAPRVSDAAGELATLLPR